MPSYEWNAFMESFFGDPYMAWHDGLDTRSLEALEGDQRKEAERLLLEALGTSDYRPSVGLRVLGSKSAVDKLKMKLGDAVGKERVETALALWEIAEWPPAVNVLINELQGDPDWGARIDAARALRDINKPEVIKALLGALEDGEDLVRSHAADSLIEMLELPLKRNNMGSYDLAIEVMMEEAGRRKKAVEELKRMVAAKQSPQTS